MSRLLLRCVPALCQVSVICQCTIVRSATGLDAVSMGAVTWPAVRFVPSIDPVGMTALASKLILWQGVYAVSAWLSDVHRAYSVEGVKILLLLSHVIQVTSTHVPCPSMGSYNWFDDNKHATSAACQTCTGITAHSQH